MLIKMTPHRPTHVSFAQRGGRHPSTRPNLTMVVKRNNYPNRRDEFMQLAITITQREVTAWKKKNEIQFNSTSLNVTIHFISGTSIITQHFTTQNKKKNNNNTNNN